MSDLKQCSSCRALIRWCVSANGKAIPMDPMPTEKGNMVIVIEENGSLTARAAGPKEDDEPRYTSHFATCPNAAQHRKSRAP